MSKDTLEEWDATASGNTDIAGIAVSDSTTPVSLDNIVREQMSQSKTALATKAGDVASGTSPLPLDASLGMFSGDITGTTTVTAVTLSEGRVRERRCAGALPITASASLIVDGATSGTTTFAAGTLLSFKGYAAGVVRAWQGNNAVPDYIKLSDTKAEGVTSGTFTSGSWTERVLNTEDTDTGNHCSLSSNRFTLSAGTYEIRASAPFLAVNLNKTRLRNATDSTDVLIGQSSYGNSTNLVSGSALLSGRFTIAASKALALEHRCSTTQATNGLGVPSTGFGVVEMYAIVELWKVG